MDALDLIARRARHAVLPLLVSLVVLALPAAVALGQEATPQAQTAQDHVLRIGRVGLNPTFDPQRNDWAVVVPGLAYEGLTKLDENLNVAPAAAESWEFSDDGMTVTFHLRDGLTYNDGSPLTAERFRYAVERACDPRTAAPYVNFVFIIAGCEAFATSLPAADSEGEEGTPMATPGAAELAVYEAARADLGVRALDDHTLQIDLVQPAGYFPAIAALSLFAPVPQEVVAADPDEWWLDPANWISNGPFQVSVIDRDLPDISVHFVPNEHYWGFADAQPRLHEIIYRYFDSDDESLAAYLRGELEVSRVPYPYGGQPEIADDSQLSQELLRIPAPNTIGFGMNQNDEPFQDKHVREAFAYGLDGEGFCREVWSGACFATSSWIPAGAPGHIETDAFAYDPEKARQALAESSYGGPENLPEVSFRYGADDSEGKAIAEWLADNYRESLGIEITLLPTTDEEWDALDEAGTVAQFDWWSWGQDYSDPQNWLSLLWTCETGYFAEPLGYCNPEFDDLVKQADQETDQDARMQLYDEAHQLLIADVPIAIGFIDTNALIVKPYVTGYDVTTGDYWPGWSSLLTVDVQPSVPALSSTPAP
jgi:oligopeptide transport system substrate-binding protein